MKKKLDWEQVKASVRREFEERPMVVLGAVVTVLYGGAALMDANTRRMNSKQDRDRIKTYDKEVERRIRADINRGK